MLSVSFINDLCAEMFLVKPNPSYEKGNGKSAFKNIFAGPK